MNNKILFVALMLFMPCVSAVNVTLNNTVDVIVLNDTVQLISNGTVQAVLNLSNLSNTSFVLNNTVFVNESVLNVTVTQFSNISVLNQSVNITVMNCTSSEMERIAANFKENVLGIQSNCVDEIRGVTERTESTSRELTECLGRVERAESRNVLNETVCQYDKKDLEAEINDWRGKAVENEKAAQYMFAFIIVLITVFFLYYGWQDGWYDQWRGRI